MDEVFAETADIFSADDLSGALEMLAGQGVVVEGASPDVAQEVADRLMPQLNYFHEMTDGGRDLQLRLASAQVAVLGLGGAGAMTAIGLAAAGVGRLVCLDAGDVTPSDVYFSPIFGREEVGAKRVERLKAHVRNSAPQVEVTALAANDRQRGRYLAGDRRIGLRGVVPRRGHAQPRLQAQQGLPQPSHAVDVRGAGRRRNRGRPGVSTAARALLHVLPDARGRLRRQSRGDVRGRAPSRPGQDGSQPQAGRPGVRRRNRRQHGRARGGQDADRRIAAVAGAAAC